MHFTTLFILRNRTLRNVHKSEIEDMFYKRFCYGDNNPTKEYLCDWFQIGGRWCDILKAEEGIHCERGWSNDNAPIENNNFSIVEIKNLIEPIDIENIYSIATIERVYFNNDDEEFMELINDINNKKINGVIALIDCHD